MSEFAIVGFCLVMGFAMSGTIASFYQLVTSEQADFFSSRPNLASWAVAVLIIMLGGPAIVVRKVWAGVRARELDMFKVFAGLTFAAMWSVLGGILFIGLLISA